MSHTLIIFVSNTPLQLSKNISQLGSRQTTDLIVIRGWRGLSSKFSLSLKNETGTFWEAIFNSLVFIFSSLGASPFSLWSFRRILGRIMPEQLGSTPLSTVPRCSVVCIVFSQLVWLLFLQLYLFWEHPPASAVGRGGWMLWTFWGLVYPSCFPSCSCAGRECLHNEEKKQNFVLLNDLSLQKCTRSNGASCVWELLAEHISFAYWLESHLSISTGCTFCLWIKSHPPHFSNLCLQILFSFKRKFCATTNYMHQFNICIEFLRILLQNCAIRWKSRPWSCCRGVKPQALPWRHRDTAEMRHSNREGESWWWHSLVEEGWSGNCHYWRSAGQVWWLWGWSNGVRSPSSMSDTETSERLLEVTQGWSTDCRLRKVSAVVSMD